MTRSDFRAFFDKDPEDSFATFDRSGNASVGLPYPTTAEAASLVEYPKVTDLEIGFHTLATDPEPLNTLLLGWKKTLKRLSIQDFRIQPAELIEVVSDAVDTFSQLKSLYELSLTQVTLSDALLENLAQLKKLRNITLSSAPLSRDSLELLAESTSIKDVMIINCSGVSAEDEQVFVDHGLRAENVRINRGFG